MDVLLKLLELAFSLSHSSVWDLSMKTLTQQSLQQIGYEASVQPKRRQT